MRLPYCEIAFRNANILASHKVHSYNSICLLHLLLWWIKPEPLVRVFFRPHPVRARAVWARKGAKTHSVAAGSPEISRKLPYVLTCRSKFLYNSGLFRIRARGGRTRESLHAPRCAHYKQEKTHWAQQFFWIDHEDVFRKSP
ncbi:hypothetical protein Bxe_A0606 [Paraburkholderia xenovorans LB400]|uniref:Uncharacterized protein n=1 Tax=Paraburkholderia xenovorans (strain LB400) TaxID=266265 RepID=Q13UB1_PARXL|nr:hypothetical protein Bxe_A0606 [Paraburkholderia xenovorans LB400]